MAKCIGTVFYNRLSCFVSEVLENDFVTVIYNKMSWYVSEVPEKDISNVMEYV